MSVKPIDIADVMLWGTRVGAVYWDRDRSLGTFQYDPGFLSAPVELSPILLPKSEAPYSFPELSEQTFKGLPGLLADSLPDKFGNLLINRWLAKHERSPDTFSPIERLCYIGTRGMGALEFFPVVGQGQEEQSDPIELAELVELANQVLNEREGLSETLNPNDQKQSEQALSHILSVGTSAGGARAKAVIAWNPETNEVRSGQVKAPPGFEYWLLKFDGVEKNRDKEALSDPKGFGRIEYAYYLMAEDADIDMNPCDLLEENGRAHFMTKRFDRLDDGGKLHMQSLCAMAHYDFNIKRAYSYEQALQVIKQIGVNDEQAALEQQVRRMMFNVVARNHDDHTKNIAFLMDRAGQWRLSPAYDMTYSYNPEGDWTDQHQMSINGKCDNFTYEDFLAVGRIANMRPPKVKKMLAKVLSAVQGWRQFAKEAGVEQRFVNSISATHRLDWGA